MNKLIKISLSISLFGILVLLFLAQNDPEKKYISEIIKNALHYQNKKVEIEAVVIQETRYESEYARSNPDDLFTVLTIRDQTGVIQATCNCHQNQNLTGKNITLTGRISEYNKKPQITADKIRIKG